jgi:hypothetical protein
MNFRIPTDLKSQFRDTCRRKRSNMSTELIRLVAQFIRLDLTENIELQRMRNRLVTGHTAPRRQLIDPNTGLSLTECL